MTFPLKYIPIAFGLIFLMMTGTSAQVSSDEKKQIITGADQTEKYLPYLKGKKIAIMANPTSIIGEKHLVDSLQSLGVEIVKVFGPEHGFRGNVGAGVHVKDEIDHKTGIPIVSLYGSKRKPSKVDLAGVDLLIYDLQDVGCRFYTNINALARLMEACQENDLELLILDRPNPNGYLIDGPVLDMKYKSGIGQFPIPMSHGLTVGEFAMMANGEGWLENKVECRLKIIPVANYTHEMPYTLPVSPSPNLNTRQAVLLYPSTCMFEGTYINHGRGTYFPFTVFGSPAYEGIYTFSFTPKSIKGMAMSPLFMNEVCYGLDLRDYDTDILRQTGQINLKWIMELYKNSPEKEKFFDGSLSNQMNNIEIQIGSGLFRQQIINEVPEKEIRASWEPGLTNYKIMRKKYLLYP
jgi:uncharacterized protein YbbC (DUF1343 family)